MHAEEIHRKRRDKRDYEQAENAREIRAFVGKGFFKACLREIVANHQHRDGRVQIREMCHGIDDDRRKLDVADKEHRRQYRAQSSITALITW